MLYPKCEYDFLIVSHHGSNNSKDCNGTLASDNGVADICTGINTHYNFLCMREYLKTLG